MAIRRRLVGSSSSTIKSHNLRAILLMLLRHERISRVRLAQLTGLSTTTITNLISYLIDQNIVVEEGAEKTKKRGVGRPRTALRLVPESQHAIAVHFGVSTIRIAVTDLLAQPVYCETLPHPAEMSAKAVIDTAAAAIQRCIEASAIDPKTLVGVGVGASGLVDPYNGINILAPNLDWHNVPIRDWLVEALRLPTCVNNNVRAMALGEAMFGIGKEVHTLAFVYAGTGVGAGIVIDGQVYSGSAAGAGEIGHTTILARPGWQPGQRDSLEDYFSEPALLRLAEAHAAEHPNSILAQHLSDSTGRPIERLFNAARAGDAAAHDLVTDRARYMGVALANLVNILNPELIVLGGIFLPGYDLLLPVLEETIREAAFANLGERVTLQQTSFGEDAGIIGAASLALSNFFFEQQEAAL